MHKKWLESVDSESALQLAMMADAADEVLILNRFFDREKYDKAEVWSTLQEFLVRTSWLFEDWGAESTGCTAHMLKLLETSRTIVLDKKARTLSYPSDAVTWTHVVLHSTCSCEVKQRCFLRMQNWLILARKCIKADFPAFESVSQFEAFALSYVPADTFVHGLARMLGLDAGLLQTEWEHMRPVAQYLHDEKDMSATDAWVEACRKNQGASRYPTLCAALARNVTRPSTPPSRGDVSEIRIDDELQLLSLGGSSKGRRKALPKHQTLLREAQALWVHYFGAARERGPKQEPAPGQKRRATNEDSETAWLMRAV